MNEHGRPSGVYGLRDPRSGVIRYVGRSQDIWNRYAGHKCPDKRTKATSKGAWVAELRALGLKPELVILEDMPALRDFPPALSSAFNEAWLEYITHHSAILKAEKRHIKMQFLAGGCDLNGERSLTHFTTSGKKTRVGGSREEPKVLPPTHVCLEDVGVGGIGSGYL